MSTQNPFAAFSENAEESDEVVKKSTGPSLTSLERIIKSSEQGKKRKVRPEEKKRLDEEKKKKNLTEIKEEDTPKKEKRTYDRKSGTGRGKEISKNGAGGKHTWQDNAQYAKTEEENYYTSQYKGYNNYHGYNGGRYYSNRYYKNYYTSNGNYYKKYNNGYGNNYHRDTPQELKEVEVTEVAPVEKEVEVKEEEKNEEKKESEVETVEEKKEETKEEGKKQKKKSKKEKKPEKEEVKKEDLLVLPENSQTLDEYLKSKGKSTLISENVKPVQVDPSLLPKSDIKKKDEALSIGVTESKKEKKQKQKSKKQKEEIDLNKMSAIQYDLDDTRKPRYFEQKEEKKEFKKEFTDKKEKTEDGYNSYYNKRGYNNNYRYNNRNYNNNYYSNKNDYNYNY